MFSSFPSFVSHVFSMGLPVSGPSVCRALCTCVVFVSSSALCHLSFRLFSFVSICLALVSLMSSNCFLPPVFPLSPSCVQLFFHLPSIFFGRSGICFAVVAHISQCANGFVFRSPNFVHLRLPLVPQSILMCVPHLAFFPTCLLYHFPVLTAGKCSEHVSCQCHGIFVFVHEIKRFSLHLQTEIEI